MIRAFVRVGLVGLILVLAAPAAGQNFDKGLEASRRGDYATAVQEWRPLAEAGDSRAQNNLGVMYDRGQGVPQDYSEAVKWYRLAAEQGLAGAQYNLGVMYANGYGVPQDYVQAHVWFNLATRQGDEAPAKMRDLIAGDMTADQIAEAQRLANDWLKKHQQ